MVGIVCSEQRGELPRISKTPGEEGIPRSALERLIIGQLSMYRAKAGHVVRVLGAKRPSLA